MPMENRRNYVAEISNVPVARKDIRPLRNIIKTATYAQHCAWRTPARFAA